MQSALPRAALRPCSCWPEAAGTAECSTARSWTKHFETVRAGEAELLNLHAHKTGALIIAAVELGCAAAGVRPDTDTRKALVRYAAELGLVFQIVDDILDVTSTTEELGKPVGSDADNDKTTFYTLYGLQGAHEEAERHNAAALAALDALAPGQIFCA